MADGKVVIIADLDSDEALKKLKNLSKNLDDFVKKAKQSSDIKIKVDADTKIADDKLKKVKSSTESLSKEKATPVISANTEDADSKVYKVKGSLNNLSNLKTLPRIDADTQAADQKVAKFKGSFQSLANMRAIPRVSADTSSAENSTSKLKTAFEQLKSKAKEASDKIKSGMDSSSKSIDSAKVSVTGLVAKFAALMGVKDLVSRAIGRVDTIDTATKLLTVLTGSADSAKLVMDDLSEAIQGTPIALDQVALGAKKMVAAGMEATVVKSVFTAIADAAYGVGNGTESIDQMTDAIASLQASSVAYSDDINRLVDAGVPAWQILANQTGMSVGEIKDYVSDGSLSSVDAINMLVDGIENGTSGIAGNTAKMSGLAKTAGDTISGSFQNARTAIVKALANIAENLKGPIIDALNWAQEKFKEFASYTASEEFKAGLTQFIETLKKVIEFAGNVIQFLQPLLPLLPAIVAAFATFSIVTKIIDGVKNAVSLLSGALSLILAHPIVAAIAAVIGVLIYLWNTNEGFRNFVIEAWNKISSVISTVGDIIGNSIGFIYDMVTGNATGMQEHLMNIYNALPPGVQGAIDSVSQVISNGQSLIHSFFTGDTEGMKQSIIGIYNSLPEPVRNALSSMGNSMINAMNNIANAAWNGINNAKDYIVNGLHGVADYLRGLPGEFWSWGADMIDGFADGIYSRIQGVINAVSSLASRVRSFLHFSEPDVGPLSDASTYMPDMMELFTKGIKSNIPLVESAINKLSQKMSIGISDPELPKEYDASMFSYFKGITPESVMASSLGQNINSRTVNNNNNKTNNTYLSFKIEKVEWSGEDDIRDTMREMQEITEREGFRLEPVY